MLTDKTKEAFEEWYYKLINSQEYKAKDFYYDMDFLPFSMQYGVMVDFFWENKIPITIDPVPILLNKITLTEARKNAILKANNLLNETN